ncbi:unnamed protein product [Rotaria magnacalcarata]|uniref:USP domain-containing protein n=1 Tax=Rotaria magnacalcarata TaxID=392030 RepID=A0A8S3IQD1_9BILA|nr:unnamed protein product [Rotaria magnacalcarata]
MLEDLFVEDGGGGEFSHQVTTVKSAEKPPAPRNETKLCGLQNQGATCYLNVLIQTLLYTPAFRGMYSMMKRAARQQKLNGFLIEMN